MTMADFTDVNSRVWNNVAYDDTAAQTDIMRKTHQEMVDSGEVVQIPERTVEQVSQSYPDLRTMKKAERTPILRQKINELKRSLRQFLNGLKGGSYEFEVNGNLLEAKLYDTGIKEVMEKVNQEKASMLYHSDQIFQNARYLYSTPDYDGDPNIYRWNYFYTPVQIGDQTVGVRIAVRDVVKGTDLTPESQIYNWGIKKGAALDGGSRGPKVASSGVSSAAPQDAALGASASSAASLFPIIPENPAGGNARSARNRAGVTAVGDEYLQQELEEAWNGAEGPSVRGPQEDGIQHRGATAVWEAAAVPNSSAGSGQRILEEGWRDEAPSVRGPEENGVHNLEGLQLLDSAENAGYDESTVWEAHRELDQDGNPVYAVTRREANIQPEDLRALQRKQRETAKRLGMSRNEASRLERSVKGLFSYEFNRRMDDGNLNEGEKVIARDIQSALEKFPEYNGRAYRNLKFDSKEEYDAFLAEYAEGSSVTLRAFTSTSKRPNGYPLFGGGVVHLVVDGYSGRDIADTYGLSRQQEVLYLPGTEMSVIRVTTANDGNPLIYLKEADDGKHRGENSEDFGDRGPA